MKTHLTYLIMLTALLQAPATALAVEEKKTNSDEQIIMPWENIEPVIEADSTTDLQVAEEKVRKARQNFDHLTNVVLPESLNPEDLETWNKTIPELEQALLRAETDYQTLKAAGAAEMATSSDFETSYAVLDEKLMRAYGKFLPDKDAYEWKIQHEIDKENFKIKKLESSLKSAPENETAVLRKTLSDLRNERNRLEKNLLDTQSEQSDDWRENTITFSSLS